MFETTHKTQTLESQQTKKMSLSGVLPVKQGIYTTDKKFLHSEDTSQKLQSTLCRHCHSAPSAHTRWPNSPRADSC